MHKGIATEGNGLQVTGQNNSGETEATRFLLISGVLVGVVSVGSRGCSMHGVQNPRERCNLISFAGEPGNLVNEMMPCRHKGHGMDPGGPNNSDELLLVEHR